MRTLRVFLAGVAVVVMLAITPAADARCRVGSPCRPYDRPRICKLHVVEVLFPYLCRRRIY